MKKEIYNDETARQLYNELVDFKNYNLAEGHYVVNPQRIFKKLDKYLKECKSILDVGCGHGCYLNYFTKEYGMKGFGFDVCDRMVAYATKQGLNVQRMPVSQMDTFKDKSYDLVYCSDVLEHLANEKMAIETIQHCSRIARKYVGLTIAYNRRVHRLNTKSVHVHKIVKPLEWWRAHVEKYVNLNFQSGKCYFGPPRLKYK